jgi:hypothetical protein
MENGPLIYGLPIKNGLPISKPRIVDPNGPMAGFPALKQGTNWFLTS